MRYVWELEVFVSVVPAVSGDRGSVGVGDRTPEGMNAGAAHLSAVAECTVFLSW